MTNAINRDTGPDSSGGHPATPAEIIRGTAGRCVACGMCLPHCPTYKKTKSELESPRGRIALMLAIAKNELDVTPRLESHLSLCLMCRACEAMCPAQVPYGAAMDAARALLTSRRKPSRSRRAVAGALLLLTRPRWLAWVSGLLRLYQRSGARILLRRSGVLNLTGLSDADAELPRLPPHQPLASFYPASGDVRGTVALFTGCVARLTDSRTLHDSVHVLTRLGYHVRVPARQSCCGALHLHQGDTKMANELMRRNLDAFDGQAETIVTTASGCGATLLEYPDAGFTHRVLDICTFLQRVEWPEDVTIAPLKKRIAVHDTCTLTHVMRAQRAPHELLRRIPQADVVALPDNPSCCGAAGAYHLEHPAMANSLRADKIGHLRRIAPDVLVTSNVGCAMHLAGGLRADDRQAPIEIMHPVTLLARQLR